MTLLSMFVIKDSQLNRLPPPKEHKDVAASNLTLDMEERRRKKMAATVKRNEDVKDEYGFYLQENDFSLSLSLILPFCNLISNQCKFSCLIYGNFMLTNCCL